MVLLAEPTRVKLFIDSQRFKSGNDYEGISKEHFERTQSGIVLSGEVAEKIDWIKNGEIENGMIRITNRAQKININGEEINLNPGMVSGLVEESAFHPA